MFQKDSKEYTEGPYFKAEIGISYCFHLM